jgi:hypothetical protein
MDMVDEAPRTPGRGGKGDRFLNENLLHAENRINVMVFGTQAIPEFWHGFRDLFGLGDDAWMKRVLIPGRQDRPDFLVLEGDVKRFWIEAELGGRNALQLGCYERARLDPPEVRSLVGPAANPANDPSLERVAAIARDAAGRIGVANRPAVEVLLSRRADRRQRASRGGAAVAAGHPGRPHGTALVLLCRGAASGP